MKRIQIHNNLIICLALFLIIGCGLKSNPVPTKSITNYRIMVKNLHAELFDDAVLLEWDFHDEEGKINYIDIEKSEVGTAGNECKDCPRRFERISQIQIKDVVLDNKVPETLNYVDKKVVKGKIYTYRLMLCDDDGICEESSAVEVNNK